jgi:drug/metabolite transporter (DMT)-like permease
MIGLSYLPDHCPGIFDRAPSVVPEGWILECSECILTGMTTAYLALAVGVVSVSIAALLIRLADAPPLVIAAYRLSLASLAIAPFALGRSRNQLQSLTGRELGLMLAAGLCLALHFGLWITSLKYTSVATSVVLVTASPIFLAVASRFLFRQRLGRAAVAGIAISLGGGILISYGNWQLGSRPIEGSLLAVGGALAVSGYLIIGQMLRRSTGVLGYVTIVYGSAALLLLLAALVLGYSMAGYSLGTYAAMGLLAAVPQLIGHSSLNWALRFVPATLVAIAVLGEPVGATLWAYLFLHEAPTASELVGGALILGGILLAMRRTTPPGTLGPASTGT